MFLFQWATAAGFVPFWKVRVTMTGWLKKLYTGWEGQVGSWFIALYTGVVQVVQKKNCMVVCEWDSAQDSLSIWCTHCSSTNTMKMYPEWGVVVVVEGTWNKFLDSVSDEHGLDMLAIMLAMMGGGGCGSKSKTQVRMVMVFQQNGHQGFCKMAILFPQSGLFNAAEIFQLVGEDCLNSRNEGCVVWMM